MNEGTTRFDYWHANFVDTKYLSHFLFLREISEMMWKHYDTIDEYYYLLTVDDKYPVDFACRVFDDNNFRCWENTGRKKIALAIFRYVITRNGYLVFSSSEIAENVREKIDLYTRDAINSMEKRKNNIIAVSTCLIGCCSVIGYCMWLYK